MMSRISEREKSIQKLAKAVIEMQTVSNLRGPDECPFCYGYEGRSVPDDGNYMTVVDHDEDCPYFIAKYLLDLGVQK